MNNEIFKMPKPVKIKDRTSSITNAFFGGIIPVIEPSDEEILDALKILGMDEKTICCAYCGAKHTEWDHLNPIVRDKRPTGYISEIHNLVPSCGKCNQSKGNKPWKEWMLGSAKLSPKSKHVSDLDERIRRLEEYERKFEPSIINIEGIIGEDRWAQYLEDLEMLHKKMYECQELSGELRGIIAKKYGDGITGEHVTQRKKKTAAEKYIGMKIGVVAQTALRSILESGDLSDKEIKLLQTKDYSKEVFHIDSPLLVRVNGKYERIRYYSNPLVIKGKSYRMCSQWHEGARDNDRPYLMKWIDEHTKEEQ